MSYFIAVGTIHLAPTQYCDLPGFYRKTGFLRSHPLALTPRLLLLILLTGSVRVTLAGGGLGESSIWATILPPQSKQGYH